MDSHPMRRGSYKLLTKLVSTAETLEKALYDILKFLILCLTIYEENSFENKKSLFGDS